MPWWIVEGETNDGGESKEVKYAIQAKYAQEAERKATAKLNKTGYKGYMNWSNATSEKQLQVNLDSWTEAREYAGEDEEVQEEKERLEDEAEARITRARLRQKAFQSLKADEEKRRKEVGMRRARQREQEKQTAEYQRMHPTGSGTGAGEVEVASHPMDYTSPEDRALRRGMRRGK
jgi:hypothetical protein